MSAATSFSSVSKKPASVGGCGSEEDVEGTVSAGGPGRDQGGRASLALVEVECRIGVPAHELLVRVEERPLPSVDVASKNASAAPFPPVGPSEMWSLAEWFAPAAAARPRARRVPRPTPRAAVRCASPLTPPLLRPAPRWCAGLAPIITSANSMPRTQTRFNFGVREQFLNPNSLNSVSGNLSLDRRRGRSQWQTGNSSRITRRCSCASPTTRRPGCARSRRRAESPSGRPPHRRRPRRGGLHLAGADRTPQPVPSSIPRSRCATRGSGTRSCATSPWGTWWRR